VVVVDGLEAELLRTLEPLPAAHDDAARRAERPRAHRRQESHATRADRDIDVTGIDAGPLHRVQRDGRRVAQRRDVEGHRGGDLEDAFDRMDHVGRVRALCVVAVLTVAEVLPAIVEAEVVAAGPAHPAVATARDRKSTRLNSSHVSISYA